MKKFVLFGLIITSLLATSCDEKAGNFSITTDSSINGLNIFKKENERKIDVYLLDTNNYLDSDGNWHENDNGTRDQFIGDSDSYIVKVEGKSILVDCGFKYNNMSYDTLRSNYKNNLLPKIQQITGGVIDYLIVTHADYDHISGLAIKGSDESIEHQTGLLMEVINGNLKINNIIDFASALNTWAYCSAQNVTSDTTFIRYWTTRMYLEQNNFSNYFPVSTCFLDMPEKEKNKEKPTGIYPGAKIYTEENFFNGVKIEGYYEHIKNDKTYVQNISSTNGKLEKEGGKYYFSIPLSEEASLNLFYNWHYDHSTHISLNSEEKNNLSVCFQVKYKNFKFLSFGDAEGKTESAIIDYYGSTSLLKDVTFFKCSHHGSRSDDNGKTDVKTNSERLFDLITPKIVGITGTVFPPRNLSDSLASTVSGSPKKLKKMFDYISKTKNNPIILATDIAYYELTEENEIKHEYFLSKPFYGDIHVSSNGDDALVTCSNHDIITAFAGVDYVDDDGKIKDIRFYNYRNKEIVSITDTTWYSTENVWKE